MIDPELLQAVRRRPADDAPRLACADVLSRRGDPLGAYIRLACDGAERRARGELDDRYVTQTLQEWALMREHRSAWHHAMGLVERKGTWHRWERGFVAEVSTDPEGAVEMRAALSALPIQLLQISYARRSDVARLVETGVLGAAPWLMLDQVCPIEDSLDAAAVRAIARAPALRRVEKLALYVNPFPGGLDIVTGAPGVAGARRLQFADAIGPAALLSAVGTWSPAVRELCLTTAQVPLDAYRRFLADPALAELEELTVLTYRDGEGDVFARALVSAPLRKLTSLHVTELSDAGVDALLRAPVIAGLRTLRFRADRVAGSAVGNLVASAPRLEELSLSGLEVHQVVVDAIADQASGALRKLMLDAGANRLDLRPLVTSSRYALEELEIAGYSVDDDFLAALAGSPFATSLRSLMFWGPVTTKGARALAASRDLLPGLAISWRGHWSEDDGTRAVEKRFPLTSRTP